MKITFERPVLTPEVAPVDASPSQESDGSFGDTLSDAIGELEGITADADRNADDLVAGKVELHTAMVSMEKADIALRVGTTVRNKLLDAYRELTQIG